MHDLGISIVLLYSLLLQTMALKRTLYNIIKEANNMLLSCSMDRTKNIDSGKINKCCDEMCYFDKSVGI